MSLFSHQRVLPACQYENAADSPAGGPCPAAFYPLRSLCCAVLGFGLETYSVGPFRLFPPVPLGNRPQIANHTAVNLSSCTPARWYCHSVLQQQVPIL